MLIKPRASFPAMLVFVSLALGACTLPHNSCVMRLPSGRDHVPSSVLSRAVEAPQRAAVPHEVKTGLPQGLIGTHVDIAFHREIAWLTLEGSGDFFFRVGVSVDGPWQRAWRGQWKATDDLLVLTVEQQSHGATWRAGYGRFVCRITDGPTIAVPEHMEGTDLPSGVDRHVYTFLVSSRMQGDADSLR
jgi:hypothetical protein